MNILIIGGTGAIGAAIALRLAADGHRVTISSRRRPKAREPFAHLDWLAGDYLKDSFSSETLSAFDAIVFAAGSDMRHVPPGDDADRHYLWANGEMVPKFAARARDAGVGTFIHIGSFYPHVLDGIVETNPYVRSRYLASERVCKLSDGRFRAISLDAPFVVGVADGVKNPMFMAYTSYARGLHAHIPPFGPAGGTNFISVRSLAEAVSGALQHGEGGKAYLVGDENLSFADFFALFFRAVGNDVAVPPLDREHPLLPDSAILQGRGGTIDYEPDPESVARLRYRRKDIRPAVEAMVRSFDAILGPIAPVILGPDAIVSPDHLRLAHLYAKAADANDSKIFDAICTDDIIVEGPGFKNEDKDEVLPIGEMLKMFFAGTRHVVTSQLVEIDGDAARGETLSTAYHLVRPADGAAPTEMLVWHIRYQDRFRRDDRVWRFSRRSLIVDWMEVRPVTAVGGVF